MFEKLFKRRRVRKIAKTGLNYQFDIKSITKENITIGVFVVIKAHIIDQDLYLKNEPVEKIIEDNIQELFNKEVNKIVIDDFIPKMIEEPSYYTEYYKTYFYDNLKKLFFKIGLIIDELIVPEVIPPSILIDSYKKIKKAESEREKRIEERMNELRKNSF